MKYSSAEKSEVVKRYQHGEPVRKISQATGISKAHFILGSNHTAKLHPIIIYLLLSKITMT